MPPKRRYWSQPDDPTAPRITLAKGPVYSNPGRCTAPLLAKWMAEKAAAGGHSLTVRRKLPGSQAYHAYCRQCGMPGKGWTVRRRKHVQLTPMVNGQPMEDGPTAAAGTLRLTFSASGPVFRIPCPGHKRKTGPRKKPPPHVLSLVEVTIDLVTGAAWVGPKGVINPRFEVSHSFQPINPTAERPPLKQLMRDAGDWDNLHIVVKPAPHETLLQQKQEVGTSKIMNVIFGNISEKNVITETIDFTK
jgi:hypothetical protein